MRIGVLGAGGIARQHLRAAADLNLEVVHICDLKTEPAHVLAEEFGIPKVSRSPASVLEDPDVDVVINALPTHLHYRWLARSARAGKHVLSEKPLCRTTAQARVVLNEFSRAGVRLAVSYQRRFSPARVRVREIVRSGGIGTPVVWHIAGFGERKDYYRGPNNWMWKLRQGGGLVMDGSIHDFDFACWVLGQPMKLQAISGSLCKDYSAPTSAAGILSFGDGHTLTYSAAWQDGRYGVDLAMSRIMGPVGTIALESEFAFTHYGALGAAESFTCDPAPLFTDQLASFLQYVRSGKADFRLAVGTEAMSSLWIAEKIVAAGSNGRSCLFSGR